MAVEPLRHFQPENTELSERKAPVIPIHQKVLEQIAPNDSAEINEQSVIEAQKIEKELLMKRYREICIDPATPAGVAWEYMQKLLSLQYENVSFEESDPTADNIKLTPGDYAHSFFTRYRRGYEELTKALNDHTKSPRQINDAVKIAQDKMRLARRNTQQFYSDETNKTHAPYLTTIENTFSESPFLSKLRPQRKNSKF